MLYTLAKYAVYAIYYLYIASKIVRRSDYGNWNRIYKQ